LPAAVNPPVRATAWNAASDLWCIDTTDGSGRNQNFTDSDLGR
jgi:hypothetical protein